MKRLILKFNLDSWWTRWLLGVAFWYAVLLVLYGAFWVTREFINEITPRDWVFNYSSIDHIDVDDSGIRMLSSTWISRAGMPIQFKDTLYCFDEPLNQFVNINTQVFENTTRTTGENQTPWVYAEPYPRDSDCYIRSTITVEYNGHEKKQIYDGLVNGKVFRTPQ